MHRAVCEAVETASGTTMVALACRQKQELRRCSAFFH
jgi:hypothetical protein